MSCQITLNAISKFLNLLIVSKSASNGHLNFLKYYLWSHNYSNNSDYLNEIIDEIFEKAFYKKHTHIIEWLKNKYTEFNWDSNIEMYINDICILDNSVSAIYLLEIFPNINLQQEFEKLCSSKYPLFVIKNFVKFYPNVEITNEIFCNACCTKTIDYVKWMIETNPNINIEYNNHLAFRNACLNNTADIAFWLQELNPFTYNIEFDNVSKLLLYNKDGSVKYDHLRLSTIISYNITTNIPINKTHKEICLICCDSQEQVNPQCGHPFCIECLVLWKSKHSDCPYCKQNMTHFTKII